MKMKIKNEEDLLAMLLMEIINDKVTDEEVAEHRAKSKEKKRELSEEDILVAGAKVAEEMDVAPVDVITLGFYTAELIKRLFGEDEDDE